MMQLNVLLIDSLSEASFLFLIACVICFFPPLFDVFLDAIRLVMDGEGVCCCSLHTHTQHYVRTHYVHSCLRRRHAPWVSCAALCFIWSSAVSTWDTNWAPASTISAPESCVASRLAAASCCCCCCRRCVGCLCQLLVIYTQHS